MTFDLAHSISQLVPYKMRTAIATERVDPPCRAVRHAFERLARRARSCEHVKRKTIFLPRSTGVDKGRRLDCAKPRREQRQGGLEEYGAANETRRRASGGAAISLREADIERNP